jgi:hypothetical protein
MEIKLIMIALVVLSLAGAGGYIVHRISSNAVAAYQQKVDEADAKLAEQDKKLQDEAANHITDMSAAYQAGAENAKGVSAKIFARGKQYAQANPAFSNVACDAGTDFVQLINYSSANLRAAAAAGFSDATMPAAGTVSGRPTGNAGQPDAKGPQPIGPVGTVHPPERPANSPSALPGSGVRENPRPKPVPIR